VQENCHAIRQHPADHQYPLTHERLQPPEHILRNSQGKSARVDVAFYRDCQSRFVALDVAQMLYWLRNVAQTTDILKK
jgi:hypothetical protein